jgi:hypothetical protein
MTTEQNQADITNNGGTPAPEVTGADTGATPPTPPVVADGTVDQTNAGAAGVPGSETPATPVTPPVSNAPGNTPAPIVDNSVKPAPVTTRQLAQPQQRTNPAPGPNAVVKTATVAAKTETRPGVVVKGTAVIPDQQLPEFVEAMKVAKSQTQSALGQIADYCKNMHPGKPQTSKSVETNQLVLLNALTIAMSSEDVNFPVVYKAIIAMVRANKTLCFRVTARNRGLNTVALATIDNKNMRFLTRVLDLMVVTSGMADIATVKQHVDMKKLFEAVTNVKIKQNLTAYYSA